VSDTPRTDSSELPHALDDHHFVVGSFFARQLERELNAANDRIKRLEEMYEGVIGEKPELLGSNVMGLLKRELNFAQNRIKRLEEAGDRMRLYCADLDDCFAWDKARKYNP
jgi:hypothetical protein